MTITAFLPLDEDGAPIAGGRVTVEPRPNYRNMFNRPAPDVIAYVTGDRGRWESGDSADVAVERLRVSHPDVFATPVKRFRAATRDELD